MNKTLKTDIKVIVIVYLAICLLASCVGLYIERSRYDNALFDNRELVKQCSGAHQEGSR